MRFVLLPLTFSKVQSQGPILCLWVSSESYSLRTTDMSVRWLWQHFSNCHSPPKVEQLSLDVNPVEQLLVESALAGVKGFGRRPPNLQHSHDTALHSPTSPIPRPLGSSAPPSALSSPKRALTDGSCQSLQSPKLRREGLQRIGRFTKKGHPDRCKTCQRWLIHGRTNSQWLIA